MTLRLNSTVIAFVWGVGYSLSQFTSCIAWTAVFFPFEFDVKYGPNFPRENGVTLRPIARDREDNINEAINKDDDDDDDDKRNAQWK